MSELNQQGLLRQTLQAIDDLQTKVAFQEHTIDELNDALTSQQYQMEKLQVQLKHVLDKVKALEPDNLAKMSEGKNSRKKLMGRKGRKFWILIPQFSLRTEFRS